MKNLELLAILGGGAIVGYFVLKNKPEMLRNITEKIPSISPVSTAPSQIIPVFTPAPRPRIPASKGCPPGTYLDKTDGILSCTPIGNTRELNPNVITYPEKMAYGKVIDNEGIVYVDNDIWNYSGKDRGYSKSKSKTNSTIGSDVGGCPPGMICSKSPSSDQVATLPIQPRTAPHWTEFPSSIFGPGWAVQTRDNYTQPLVQPDINKQIESEIKKKHQKEVKHQKKTPSDPLVEERYPSKIKKEYDPHKKRLAEIPTSRDHIGVQMECPSDLSKLPCGSECIKNGKVHKVVCSSRTKIPGVDYPVIPEHHGASPQETRDILAQYPPDKTDSNNWFPTTRRRQKRPTLTVPPNFPGAVTISPGETPYPEDTGGGSEQDIGGTQPGERTTPSGPDWNPPQEDTSGVVTTPPKRLPHRQPQIGPIKKEPTRQPQITPGPRGGSIGSLTEYWNHTKCSRAADRPSCRKQGDIPAQYKTGNYGVRGSVTLRGKITRSKDHGSPGTEITSGGPGSKGRNCCGITMGVHNDDGYVFSATEDWTISNSKHSYICDDSPHREKGIKPCTPNPRPVFDPNQNEKKIDLDWQVRTDGKSATYTGTINGTTWSVPGIDPKDGSAILPGRPHGSVTKAGDPTRLRADGTNDMDFNGDPQIYSLAGYYRGPEGFMDDGWDGYF
jgi:hypothetical protein